MTVQANDQKRNPGLGRHAVIVGGGISGLSAAFFLPRRAAREHLPLKITVLEASDRFGGALRTLTHGDLRMEAGADAFYAGQSDATDLCRELGLEEEVIRAASCFRNFFGLKDKKFFPVPGLPASFWNILRFFNDPRLSFSTKCRMLGEPLVPRRKESGDESFASFIRRRLGEGFYRTVAMPLVQGVYMMDPERLSLGAMFPKLRKAERVFGSLTGSFLNREYKKNEKGSSEFLKLKHGFEELIRALVRELEECDLRNSAPVRQCAYSAGTGWEISMEDGSVLRADILGLAMNACDSSRLLTATAPGLSRALSAIQYDSIATVALIYESEDVPARGLGPGFLVPMEGDRYPFSSLKWLGKSEDGKCLHLRAFLSEAMTPGVFSESDETLKQRLLTFLNDFLGVRAKPLFMSVERYPNALPQYETEHLERVARIEKEILQYPGLFLAGNGFRGFGITDCIRQSRIAASGLPLPIF